MKVERNKEGKALSKEKEKSPEEGKESKEKFFKGFKDSTSSSVKKGISLSKEASSKLNESSRIQYMKTNIKPVFNEIRSKSSKAISEGRKSSKGLEKAPLFFQKVASGSLSGLEKIVGRIRIGTQYGKTSLDVLEELAKMKELGIITEDEYLNKKKEILDRI